MRRDWRRPDSRHRCPLLAHSVERPGERLTERDALEALLLPSANNIAEALATYTSGSTASFVGRMNATAAALHMKHTTYTDPSGLLNTTVSTARDQLRLARVAMRDPTFAAVVAMPEAFLPVVGRVTNTNTLLGHDEFMVARPDQTEQRAVA